MSIIIIHFNYYHYYFYNFYSWFSLAWWDGHIGVQNNGKISFKFCLIIESNSQRTFSLLFCTPTWPPWRHMKTENYCYYYYYRCHHHYCFYYICYYNCCSHFHYQWFIFIIAVTLIIAEDIIFFFSLFLHWKFHLWLFSHFKDLMIHKRTS